MNRNWRAARAWLLERSGFLLRAVETRRHRDDAGLILRAAQRTMRSKTYCVLVTDGPDGPSARVVQPFRPGNDLTVHIGTSPTSRKARETATTGRVLLIYERDRDAACVVARCRAYEVKDSTVRLRYFMPFWRAFWPDGPGGDFTVIRCEPYTLEVWDARRGVTPPPFGLRAAVLNRDGGTWRHDSG